MSKPRATCLILVALTAGACHAQTTTYPDRVTFEAQLTSMFTDDYTGYPMFINPKAIMDGVHNQTRYSSTGHNPPNHNLITGFGSPNERYCAGCNGSFELDFTATTYGTMDGVNGVGFEFTNSASLPYFLWITFGDLTTQDIPLATGGPIFFGMTSSLRIKTIHFGLSMGATTTSGSFTLDNLTIGETTPPPTCSVVTPPPTSADVSLSFDAQSTAFMALDLAFEYSSDGGMTFAACTAAAGSLLGNPSPATPIGMGTFLWDSVADGVAVVAPVPDVVLRLLVDDGTSATVTCDTMPFEVDNSFLCTTICGDCNLNMIGGEIIDALAAAQIAAGLLVPTMAQEGCCDVDFSMSVTVLDALGIAQDAAGLPVTLTCP